MEALIPGERDGVTIGADVLLKAMGRRHDVVAVACGCRSLSDPEGRVRIAELGMRGDEDPWYEIQDPVEGVKEGDLRINRDLVGRGDGAQRNSPTGVHARAHWDVGRLAFRLSSASRSR